MPAEPRDSDVMYGKATLDARDKLADRLIASTPIATAAITCDSMPLQIEGALTDGRPFYFRARNGTASLSIVAVGKNPVLPDARTETTPCPHGLATENIDKTLELMRTLLADYDL